VVEQPKRFLPVIGLLMSMFVAWSLLRLVGYLGPKSGGYNAPGG